MIDKQQSYPCHAELWMNSRLKGITTWPTFRSFINSIRSRRQNGQLHLYPRYVSFSFRLLKLIFRKYMLVMYLEGEMVDCYCLIQLWFCSIAVDHSLTTWTKQQVLHSTVSSQYTVLFFTFFTATFYILKLKTPSRSPWHLSWFGAKHQLVTSSHERQTFMH